MHPDTIGVIAIAVFSIILWIALAENNRRAKRREAIAAAKRRHPSSVARRPDAADRALAQYTQRARDLGYEPRPRP